jgi:hypothetical protein
VSNCYDQLLENSQKEKTLMKGEVPECFIPDLKYFSALVLHDKRGAKLYLPPIPFVK